MIHELYTSAVEPWSIHTYNKFDWLYKYTYIYRYTAYQYYGYVKRFHKNHENEDEKNQNGVWMR